MFSQQLYFYLVQTFQLTTYVCDVFIAMQENNVLITNEWHRDRSTSVAGFKTRAAELTWEFST